MTWQHFVKTLMMAMIGAAGLVSTSRVHAEGGEVSSLVPPQMAEVEASVSVPASEQSDALIGKAKKPGKVLNTQAGKEKANKTASPVSGMDKPEASSAQQEEINVEQTAAIPLQRLELLPTSRQSDAIRAGALRPLIARHASENGLPYGLADAVVRLESRYNPAARRGANLGLTQINFQTAQSLGYQGAAAGLLDAETNLRYGLKYLAQAYRLAGGDTCGTILRYQFGHRTETMNGASRAYCAKVKVITAVAE